MKEIVEKLLSTEETQSVPLLPINLIEEQLNALGFVHNETETNGWQHDFWIYFLKGDIKIELTGSWYYGNYKLGLIE